jgi:hypothetical protein
MLNIFPRLSELLAKTRIQNEEQESDKQACNAYSEATLNLECVLRFEVFEKTNLRLILCSL